ncbi:MAG: DUF3019 domain-containing protein [Colwellia sp.]|nr:DUF3019 domain-containing protein [Colwellia sp.]
MYSSVSKGISLLVYSLYIGFISAVKADDNTTVSTKVAFSVQPQQCVTLRQGRDCFATITVHWQKLTEQSLCLYQINTKQTASQKQLICWPKSNKGQASVAFESSDNLTYQLRTLQDKQLVAEAEIVVSWVHKNTTVRRRWRLF